MNKAFEKVARATEEPGKGMKWFILPEYRDELVRTAYRGGRGGHRGSSNPSSPNQLNYVNHGPKEMAAREQGSARKRKVSPTGSPQSRSAPRSSHMTPDRSSRRLPPDDGPGAADGSPVPPRSRKGTAAAAATAAAATAAAAAAAAAAAVAAAGATDSPAPGSPTLATSYLDDGAHFVTPAPHRVEVKLNPPSTLQRPSQHMPTSSPAPFWKYADIGSTPLKQPSQFDVSPSRTVANLPSSSSPAPAPDKSPATSPKRDGGGGGGGSSSEAPPQGPAPVVVIAAAPAAVAETEEDRGFDLTK